MFKDFGIVGLAVGAAMMASSAGAVTIDIDDFTPGDNLAQVNAVTAPLGATFSGANISQFGVLNEGGDDFLRNLTVIGGADILINFTSPVTSVTVNYPVTSTQPTNIFVSLTAYDGNGVAAGFPGAGLSQVAFASGNAPESLTVAGAGILSVQIESNGTFVSIDEVSYSVPLPASALLLLSGLGALALRRAV